MDIPLDAKVSCTDGTCGTSVAIIVDPVKKTVTHFVLQVKGLHHDQYLVPVGMITDTTSRSIQLNCKKDEIVDLAPFKRDAVVGDADVTRHGEVINAMEGTTMAWPYSTPSQASYVSFAKAEAVPHDELAVHRGDHVHASDGKIGTVEELLVEPETSYITHLVLRQGHMWGKRDVAIPIDQIDHVEKETVFLKLDKSAVGDLPIIELKK